MLKAGIPRAGSQQRISSLSKREARSPSGNTVSSGLGGHVEGKKFARRSSKRGEVVAGAAVKSTARRKTGVGSRRSARRAVFSEGSNRTVIEEKEKERGKKEGGRVGSRMRDKGSLFCGVVGRRLTAIPKDCHDLRGYLSSFFSLSFFFFFLFLLFS